VTYTDSIGQKKSAFFEALAGASFDDITNHVLNMQAASDLSIQAISVGVSYAATDAPPANAYSAAGHPYALLTEALDMNLACGPGQVNTRLSVLGPNPTNIIKQPRDKAGLNPASALYADILGTAVIVQVNTAGQPVANITATQVQGRKNKSRLM
jgi:hypothetical protein